MKRLFLVAAFAVVAMVLGSCDQSNVSATDALTIKDGWQLAEGTIVPAYELLNGDLVDDVMDFLLPCEQDDNILFNANGSETIKTNVTCADSEGEFGLQDPEVAALWHFDNPENPERLYLQLPFFYNDDMDNYDEELENCEIINLTKDEMKLRYTLRFTNAKGDDEKYTFTFVYRPSSKVSKR